MMDNRLERVSKAQEFYLQYLLLMNHYEQLDKDVKAKWKEYLREAEGEGADQGDTLKNKATA
jgi:hypothetical protein